MESRFIVLSFYLTIWDYSQWRLLDELLTVLDNDTLVVLINFHTEEGVNYFQMYLKNSL